MLIAAIALLVLLLVVSVGWIIWTRAQWLLIARVIYHDAPRPFRDARAIWDLLGVVATLDRSASMFDRRGLHPAVRRRIEWALLRRQDDDAPVFVQQLHDSRRGTTNGRIDLKQARLRHDAARHAYTVGDTEARSRMYEWLQTGQRGWRRALLDYVLTRRKRKSLEAARWAALRLAAAQGESNPPETSAAAEPHRDDPAARVARHEAASDEQHVIEVENCFALTRAVDDIKRYFNELAEAASKRQPFEGRFLAPVRIRDGYFAPLHLLAGALVEFENDWGPAIKQYGRAVAAQRLGAGNDDLLRLREFAFNCWLSWGPSIPVCTCTQWKPGNKPDEQPESASRDGNVAKPDDIAEHRGDWSRHPVFQYGYGDEANSVSAVFEQPDHGKPLFEYFQQRNRHGTLALARPLQGHITLGPILATHGAAIAMCPAQADLARDWDRLVVRVDPPANTDPGSPLPRPGYYSAYLWVMFELREGATRAPTAEAWRHLLPFFEHGNLADPDAYEYTRQTLARKIAIALEEILTKHPTFNARYACAFDDSNCGAPLWCGPGPGSLRAMLQTAIDDPAKPLDAWNRRVIWEIERTAPDMAWLKYVYSSCHLPDRLRDYFAGLEATRSEEDGPSYRSLRIRELDATPESLAYLRSFYGGLYTDEFPDPDERESLENMERYLSLKAQGWYGANNYHIVVAELDRRPVGGFIIDYLAQANAGVIEFLFVARSARARGLGRLLREEAELLLRLDALAQTRRELDWIVAEMNDPFVRPDVPDNMDPFERAEIWGRWGYDLLDFPYVQPPLSADQEAVTGLGLICKCLKRKWHEQGWVPGPAVADAVAQYLEWAMRIAQPGADAHFQKMKAHLDSHPEVKLLDLSRYAGSTAAEPCLVTAVISDATDPAFTAAMDVYARTFRSRSAAVPRSAFEQALRDGQAQRYGYHLWALKPDAAAPVAGIASFFSLSGCGFGGYLALEHPMRRTGRLAPLIARIERTMLADTGAGRGWYIECDDATEIAPFVKVGFRVIALPYTQPALDRPASSGPRMRLLYKPFGRVYGAVALQRDEFLRAVEAIYRHVYGIDDPAAHPGLQQLAAAATSETVPFDPAPV